MSSMFRQKAHHVCLQHARQPRAQLLPASHGLVRAPAVHSPIAQCLRNKKTCSDMHMSPHTHIYMEDAWQTSSHIELTLQRGPHYNITSSKKTSSHIESTFQPKDNNSNNNNKNSTSNSNIELKKQNIFSMNAYRENRKFQNNIQLSAVLFGALPTYQLNQVQAWWYSC